MSGLTYKDQTLVRDAVQDYLDAFGMTSLRKIAEYVRQRTGITPSASTISRLVKEFGYNAPNMTWEKVK